MVCFAKVVILIQIIGGIGGLERKVAFVAYMEVMPPSEALEKNLGCNCVRWSMSE